MRHIVTKKSIRYGGRRYQPGDAIELIGRDARLFRALGLVADPLPEVVAPPVEVKQVIAAPVIVENRAMRAEPVKASERVEKPKRPYKRRDVSAE